MIIGLSGQAGSGKTTAADYLVRNHGFTRQRFAGPLKDMVRALGLNDDHIEGALKETPSDALNGHTPRFAMQTIGTQWGREIMGADFWVKAWKARLLAGVSVVAEDVRFQNEALAIEAVGGFLIHLDGRGGINSTHESEGFVPDNAMFLTNAGSMSHLYAMLDSYVAPICRRAA